MLKEKTYKEQYQVIGNGIFATIKETGEKRELDGDELIKFLEQDNLDKETKIVELQKEINELRGSIAENTGLIRQSLLLYTKELVRDTITGVALKDDKGNLLYKYVKRGV